ncbi:MAG TPA: protein translocase subunit SecF [Clostridiaceae bacterium]|nr:protein translocase subunit SecF [Clostridiaceae bacterium]
MFSFYKNRYKFLIISMAALLAGIIVLATLGLKLDIQFKGGSILKYTFEGDIDLTEADTVVEEILGVSATLQETVDLSTERKNLVVSIAGDEALSTEQQTALRTALDEAFSENNIEVKETNVVDPYIGKETLNKGLLAVVIASILIVFYVWIRFRSISGPSAGVFSLLALLHDVVLTFFVFVLLRTPMNDTLIAVMLSILGWSVNDTIVIFDRIRENSNNRDGKETLPELVDRSINQMLTRSITTSTCAFIAVGIAYGFAVFYNIESIRNFALPMMIGIIIGTYSSIFLATPFWVQWMTRGGRLGFES